MTLQQFPISSNHFFNIWWDDNPAFNPQMAFGRARALQSTCDEAFKMLMQWFGVSSSRDFAPDNQIRVDITDDPKLRPNGLGTNSGYSRGGMHISVTIYTQPHPDIADDVVRSVWLHEAAEILMSYRKEHFGGRSWDPRSSDGEGLAHTLAGLFYPRGFYGGDGGPRSVEWWMNREDHVTSNDVADGQTDPVSVGCAIVFLFYLYTQLGYAFDDIIANAGDNLEETFHALTNGRSGGFAEMMQVIDRHIGPGVVPGSDDPFPLGAVLQRVSIRDEESEREPRLPPMVIARGSAAVRPFFTCPMKTYQYVTYSTNSQLVCTAEVSGFGAPSYDWVINGVPVTGSGTTNIPVFVAEDDPQPQGTPPASRAVEVTYSASEPKWAPEGQRATLTVNMNASGHGEFDIDVYVNESYPHGVLGSGLPPRRASGHFTLDTQKTYWLAPFDSDRQDCQAQFERSFEKYVQIHRVLGGHRHYGATAYLVEQTKAELEHLMHEDPATALDVGVALSSRLGLPQGMLGVR